MKKKDINYDEIQKFYDLGNSITDCCKHFNLGRTTLRLASKNGLLKTRSISDAQKILQERTPKHHTNETKEKLRQAMLNRRANGYNWSFAHSKNNGISYPEQFWITVIKNEFVDQNYEFQYQMGRFAIDFAWPHKKIALEIDGEQHYTDIVQMKRDQTKDQLLTDNGWTVIRVRWKHMFNNPKPEIGRIKNLIDY